MTASRLSVKAVLAATTMGQRVVVHGWLRTRRTSKNFSFLVVNDGSAQESLQVVADSSTQGYEQIEAFDTGVSLRVEGEIKASQGQQRVELLASALTLIGAAPDYPMQKKGHTLEFLREQAHLRARTNTFGAVFRVKDSAARATHDFFIVRVFTGCMHRLLRRVIAKVLATCLLSLLLTQKQTVVSGIFLASLLTSRLAVSSMPKLRHSRLARFIPSGRLFVPRIPTLPAILRNFG